MTIVLMALLLMYVTYIITFRSEFDKEDLQKSVMLAVAVMVLVFIFALVTT